jgi:pyruvate dehydrogenase E2 component (dihydrolipoamide acetyltransferase)
MDSPEGLFVPVIHNIKAFSDPTLRQLINEYKQAVSKRSLPPQQFQGASITLSNFGKFAGRFATPLIIPPMVTILAVGRLYTGIVSVEGVPQSRALLPLSLSFDHRAVTGGEASRFLGVLITALQATNP